MEFARKISSKPLPTSAKFLELTFNHEGEVRCELFKKFYFADK